jgi:hypothetical protein
MTDQSPKIHLVHNCYARAVGGWRHVSTRASGEMVDALVSGASVRTDVGEFSSPHARNECMHLSFNDIE